MPHPTNKSLPARLQPWLTLLSSFGISAAGAGAVVAALWQSAKGQSVVDTRLLLVLSAGIVSLFALGVWWLVRLRRQIAALKRPPHFQDDYTFDPKTGLFRHNANGGLYCGHCVLDSIRSPVTESPEGWRCLHIYEHWFPNPDAVPF